VGLENESIFRLVDLDNELLFVLFTKFSNSWLILVPKVESDSKSLEEYDSELFSTDFRIFPLFFFFGSFLVFLTIKIRSSVNHEVPFEKLGEGLIFTFFSWFFSDDFSIFTGIGIILGGGGRGGSGGLGGEGGVTVWALTFDFRTSFGVFNDFLMLSSCFNRVSLI